MLNGVTRVEFRRFRFCIQGYALSPASISKISSFVFIRCFVRLTVDAIPCCLDINKKLLREVASVCGHFVSEGK